MSNHSSSEETRMAFLKRWAQWEVVENDCNTIFRYLQEKGISSIGAIGFCWGVWMAFRASAAGFPLKAGAGCHPSIRLEQFSGGSEDQLSRSVKCPMALASARNDPDNVQTGGSVHAILSSLHPASEVRSFGEVDHGWVTRGDLNDEVVAKNVRDALQFCQDFFLSTL
jgi:dienelactone hydrolase